MEWQTPMDMYILVVAAFLPLVISFFKDLAWSEATKKIVFVIFAFLAALGHLFFAEGVTWTDVPITMLKVGVLMQTVYSWIWKPTGIDGKIAASIGIGSSRKIE